MGESLASPLLSLLDDPTDPLGPGASRTDDDMACRQVGLIDGGRLTGYLHAQ
ncbi:MAG: hypothetical protein IPF42_06340 [Candidatus Microthrix sp.]|nr:hypothetical protein [Candidatus Microthrix sp.]